MEIKKINIEKATITETIKDKIVFIEIFKEIIEGKAKVRIEGPTWFGSYIIELEEFEKDIPFEEFIETVKNQIEKAEVFSIEYIMKKIAFLFSKYKGIWKIKVDFSDSSEETLDLHNFIKNYNEWAHPVGFEYPRVTAILTVQDFANIMCIILLYLMSFLLFYKNEDNKKNKMIKIYLAIMSILVLFIVIVNRSKMVYISLLPTILYIMYKKRKRYVLAAILMCFTGYFALPVSISNRIQYIVKYKNDPSSNLRVIFWKTGAEAFKQKPLYGWRAEERKKFNLDYYKKTGVSDYVYKYFLTGNKLRTQHYVASHNSYLQYLLDFGILGFVFFILMIISLLVKLFKMNFYKYDKNTKIIAFEIGTKVSFLAWIIQGMTDDNLNDKHLIITLTVLIFFIDYLYRNIKNQKNLNLESIE